MRPSLRDLQLTGQPRGATEGETEGQCSGREAADGDDADQIGVDLQLAQGHDHRDEEDCHNGRD